MTHSIGSNQVQAREPAPPGRGRRSENRPVRADVASAEGFRSANGWWSMKTISPALHGAVVEVDQRGLCDLDLSILEKDLLITEVLGLLPSNLGSCAPKPRITAAMKNSNHDDSFLFSLHEKDHSVWKAFNQSSASLPMKGRKGFRTRPDLQELLAYGSQKAQAEARALIVIPSRSVAEVFSCLWAYQNPHGWNRHRHATPCQSACSSSSNTCKASLPGLPSRRKASSRSSTRRCSCRLGSRPPCSAAIESQRAWTNSSRWARGRLSNSWAMDRAGQPPDV